MNERRKTKAQRANGEGAEGANSPGKIKVGDALEYEPEEIQERDMFEQTQYKAFFENSVTEEFEDFVY